MIQSTSLATPCPSYSVLKHGVLRPGSVLSLMASEAVPPVKEYDKSKLLIKHIPKEAEENLFCLFIEKCLGLDHETDFTFDLRSGIAVLFFGSSYTDEGIFNYH